MVAFLGLLAFLGGALSWACWQAPESFQQQGRTILLDRHHMELMSMGFLLGTMLCIVGACVVAKGEQIRAALAAQHTREND